MTCFKRMLSKHIKASLPLTLDPHQYTYKANSSTEDAIATAPHSALNHLEHSGIYVRMLFVDYSSVFNTIIPDRPIRKLSDLDLSSLMCFWITLSHQPSTHC